MTLVTYTCACVRHVYHVWSPKICQ